MSADKNIDHLKGVLSWSNPGLVLAQRGASLANDASETTIVTKSIPAGALATNNILHVQHVFRYLNNSGVDRSITVRFTFGSTLIFSNATVASTNAVERIFLFDIYVCNAGATNSQTIVVVKSTMFGNLSSAAAMTGDDLSSVEDTTAATAITITWQHSAAVATVTADERFTKVELIGVTT
jgi:hypothetical protein